MKAETRQCQNCRQQFNIEPDDFAFYQKIGVPPPTLCPECRTIRRFAFWNEHNLFRAPHYKTGEEIFSLYPREANIRLYDHDFWWSDKWDEMEYGREYDFGKPFFSQFNRLYRAVPHPSRSIWHLEASDYCNNTSRIKNCYLCFDADESEDCLYGIGFRYSKRSVDFGWSFSAELCYEVYSVANSYKTFFSNHCLDCRDVWFSEECRNCSNCFGCINLRSKQYHIFNVPYSKEEYFEKIKEFNLGSFNSLQAMKKQAYDFWLRNPRKFMHGLQNENVIGEYIYHSKNIRYSYKCENSKDLKYCDRLVNGVATSYDYTHWGDNCELMYECLTCGENCRKVRFSIECWPACENVEYSVYCHSSTNLFGCVGLKKKSYCIFNKQYSKEEYFKLRDRIIQHMNEMPYISEVGDGKLEVRKIEYRYGEFFPPEFSPFGYNETLAQEFFPLTKIEAETQGFLWREPHFREFEITILADKLPDHIKDATDDISKQVIGCFSCRHAFRILPRELEFYKFLGLPLPRLCHNCRYQERVKFRNPLKWWKRKCVCGEQSANRESQSVYKNTVPHFHGVSPCPNEFETSYAPERPEIVYCENCYNSEVA